MRIAYHIPDIAEGTLAAAVRDSEITRQKAETSCVLFVNDNGTELMLVSHCDGESYEDVLRYANLNSNRRDFR